MSKQTDNAAAEAAAAEVAPFGFDWPVVFSYTRAQAIADGVLADVSEQAREHGFVWHVAITSAAFADCVDWSEEDNKRKGTGQDVAGRLSDVLCMAAHRLRYAAQLEAMPKIPRADGSISRPDPRMIFQVLRTPREGRGHKARMVYLVLHVGPGDAGEPVLTIMLPTED